MLICLLIVLLASTYANNLSCPQPPKLYNEIGCVPGLTSSNGCIESYVCPKYTTFNKHKCYYQGVFYSVGDALPTAYLPSCFGTCICSHGLTSSAFVCRRHLCPAVSIGSSCVLQNYLNQCCETQYMVCGNATKQLPTCIVNGQKYVGGNVILINDAGYRCICDANFKNDTSWEINKNCEPIQCNSEMTGYPSLVRGCVPIYNTGPMPCCPEDYRCPSTKDYIVRAPNPIGGPTCKFGNLKLNRMDSLNINSRYKCVSCVCLVPPMVECTIMTGCSEPSFSSTSSTTSSFLIY